VLSCFLALVSITSGFSQTESPYINWEKTYGGSGYEKLLNAGVNWIDMRGYSRGIYIIQVNDLTQKGYQQKLILE